MLNCWFYFRSGERLLAFSWQDLVRILKKANSRLALQAYCNFCLDVCESATKIAVLWVKKFWYQINIIQNNSLFIV
jgi:hypothetical protein